MRWTDLEPGPEALDAAGGSPPPVERELAGLASALGELGYERADLPIPLDTAPAAVQRAASALRYLAVAPSLTALALVAAPEADLDAAVLALAAVEPDTLVFGLDASGAEVWLGSASETGPLAVPLARPPEGGLPSWTRTALALSGDPEQPARAGRVLERLLRELRARAAEAAELRREHGRFLDDLEYFCQRVCPRGSHRGQDTRELERALARYPLLPDPRGRGVPRRQPQGAERVAYEALRGELVRRHARLGLRMALARQRRARSLEIGDLLGLVVLGLFKAVDRYDPARGSRLATYGTWWITQQVRRGIDEQDRFIRIPVHRLSDRASSAQLAPAVRNAPLSLDVGDEAQHEALLLSHGRALWEAQERELARAELRELLAEALGTLDPRDRFVLEQRFGLDGNGQRTLEEVGAAVGVTRERVRQREARALQRLTRNAFLRQAAGHDPQPSLAPVPAGRPSPGRRWLPRRRLALGAA